MEEGIGSGLRQTGLEVTKEGAGCREPKQSENHSGHGHFALFSLQPCKMSKVELNLLVKMGIQVSNRKN